MKKFLFVAMLFIGMLIAPAQVAPLPEIDIGYDIELATDLEYPVIKTDVIVIDQLEARFIPDIVKNSQVLSNNAYREFDWNNNPYEADVLVSSGPSWQYQSTYSTNIPNTLYGTSGGLSDRQ